LENRRAELGGGWYQWEWEGEEVGKGHRKINTLKILYTHVVNLKMKLF
jgi:hypothetical protein